MWIHKKHVFFNNSCILECRFFFSLTAWYLFLTILTALKKFHIYFLVFHAVLIIYGNGRRNCLILTGALHATFMAWLLMATYDSQHFFFFLQVRHFNRWDKSTNVDYNINDGCAPFSFASFRAFAHEWSTSVNSWDTLNWAIINIKSGGFVLLRSQKCL